MKHLFSILFFLIAPFIWATSCEEWTFNTDPPGKVPQSWKARGDNASSTYSIKEENGNRYLHADSIRSGVQLGIELKSTGFADYTLLWKWRVHLIPQNGDERKTESMDSAAAVYAVFGRGLFPKILKYVWSSTLKPGTVLKHPRSSNMRIIVLGSGSDPTRSWEGVARNLKEDFKAQFGSEPKELTAIGVKTDSDSTRSHAKADYDDFQLCRNQ